MLASKLLSTVGGSAEETLYVDDVFGAHVRTGTGATVNVVNGVDLAGKGGMVWVKSRSNATQYNIFDTARGYGMLLSSNSTAAQLDTKYDGVPSQKTLASFNSDGYTIGADSGNFGVNLNSTYTFVDWTFRKAPKFFDVVTFTSGSNTNRRISHSLGQAPGMILLKRTDGAQGWYVYHRSNGRNGFMQLETTGAFTALTNSWGTSDPTSTDFGVDEVNLLGASRNYVAYLFAHDSSADGIVQCGSYTGNGGTQTIDCGFTTGSRFVLIKRTDSTGDWYVWDTARGIVAGNDPHLSLNTTAAEVTTNDSIDPVSSGFAVNQLAATNINVNAASYIFLSFS